MIAVIEISFFLRHRIDREVEEIGGLALSVDFHVESLSAVQVLPFTLANGGGAEAGPGPGDVRDSERRPSKAEFPSTQICRWAARDRIEGFWVLSAVPEAEESVVSSSPTRTAGFVTPLRPCSYLHRPQWKRCGLGVRGWRCCERVVARRCKYRGTLVGFILE